MDRMVAKGVRSYVHSSKANPIESARPCTQSAVSHVDMRGSNTQSNTQHEKAMSTGPVLALAHVLGRNNVSLDDISGPTSKNLLQGLIASLNSSEFEVVTAALSVLFTWTQTAKGEPPPPPSFD